MKTVQKLEVCFGFAPLVATLIVFISVLITELTTNGRKFNSIYMENLYWTFSIIIAINLLLVFGAYFHAARRNKLGFTAVIIIGGILSIYFGVLFFSGGALYYYGAGGFLFAVPGIFAVLTIVFALRQAIENRRLEIK
jgi:Na+-driven multidrug efflux pump